MSFCRLYTVTNLLCFTPPPATPVSFSLCDRRRRDKGREISGVPERGGNAKKRYNSILFSRAPYFRHLAISAPAVHIRFLLRASLPYTLAPLFLTYNVWFHVIFVFVLMANEENFLTASVAYYREGPILGQNGLDCLELVW